MVVWGHDDTVFYCGCFFFCFIFCCFFYFFIFAQQHLSCLHCGVDILGVASIFFPFLFSSLKLVVLALLCVYAGMYVYLHRKLDQHRLDMESLRNNMNIVDSFTFVHEDDDDDLMTIEFNRSPQQSPRNSPGRSAIEMVQKTITSIGKAAKSSASSAASSTSGSRNDKNGKNGHQRQHEYSKLNMDDDDA
jgi:hypothetical protein